LGITVATEGQITASESITAFQLDSINLLGWFYDRFRRNSVISKTSRHNW
jgi:hypothetical protein